MSSNRLPESSASASGNYILRNTLGEPWRTEHVPWHDDEYEQMGILIVILSYIFIHNKEAEIGTCSPSSPLPYNKS